MRSEGRRQAGGEEEEGKEWVMEEREQENAKISLHVFLLLLIQFTVYLDFPISLFSPPLSLFFFFWLIIIQLMNSCMYSWDEKGKTEDLI